MRKPRSTILLLTAIVAAFGLNTPLQRAEMTNWNAVSGRNDEVAVSKKQSLEGEKVDRESVQIASVERLDFPVTSPRATKTYLLSDDANTLVSEMCSLHLLADKADLSLSSQEWSALAAVVLQIQAIRQSYEAEIATSRVIAPGRYRLEIPAYAGVGDALREKFHADLRTELGDAKAIDVLAKLGGRLEGHFAGFGVGMQTLDITASSGGSLSDVEVTRTVTYWNSVEGGDSLTTRREVHFPALEDPAGDSWSRLLAVVKA